MSSSKISSLKVYYCMDQQGQFSCVYLVSPPPNPHQPGFHCCPSLELNPPAFCRPSAGFKGWYLYDNSLLYRNIQRTVGLLLKCCWLSKRAISAALKGLLWELLNSGYFLIEYFQGTNLQNGSYTGIPCIASTSLAFKSGLNSQKSNLSVVVT